MYNGHAVASGGKEMSEIKFTDNVVGTGVVNVTENDVEGIIVGALEGGSNYWMGLDNTKAEWAVKPKGVPLSTWTTHLLITGHSVYVFDNEEYLSGDGKGEPLELFELTLTKLLNGIELNRQQRPKYAVIENMDASDYDCIIQYALFGEVKFG
jgi:hypothetical protein